METGKKTSSEIEKSLPLELQTDQDGYDPGLDLTQSDIEEIIRFMKEELGITNPLDPK